jgi:dTDP-glucose 4,6-dehydratase
MVYLITGGAGFIGSNFVRFLLNESRENRVIVLDALTYAGNLDNLKEFISEGNILMPRRHLKMGIIEFDERGVSMPICSGESDTLRWSYKLARFAPRTVDVGELKSVVAQFLEIDHRAGRLVFVLGSIVDLAIVDQLMPLADYLVNLAAESHVDRSIEAPATFLNSDILGTHTLLEAARKQRTLRTFLHMSTDEVYGSTDGRGFTETAPLNPTSPYSASKAAADHQVLAYGATYGLPVLILRPTNNFGSNQYPEKLIPLMIIRALLDQPLPLYGDGLQVRNWLHVSDTVAALALVLRSGVPGEIYNVSGGNEHTNIEIVHMVLDVLGKNDDLIRHVTDRPGHDRRYAVDDQKLRRLGFRQGGTFIPQLEATIYWYIQNREWWSKTLEGDEDYRQFIRTWYEGRK